MRKEAIFILCSLLMIGGCNYPSKKETADTIYYGGDILTMEGKLPTYVEAVAIKRGKIIFTGSKNEAEQFQNEKTEIRDLKGKTLIPGFIDAHSHITMGADALNQANLNPAPVGNISSIADIIEALKNLKERLNAKDGEWLVGSGYDQDFLKEKRHPTSDDLDAAFPSNPVILLHTSGHMLVANSLALELAGIDANTENPVGGTIVRKADGSNEPNGLCQEMAAMAFMPFLSKPLPMNQEIRKMVQIQDYYASCGITTANDGLSSSDKMKILEATAKKKKFKIDVIALPMFSLANELVGTGRLKWGVYQNRLKYQGLKITVDGSPQGKTAFLTKAYLTPVPGCNHDCKGFANLTQADVNQLFLNCYSNKVQVFSHCNGDAAVDMMIQAHRYAEKKLGKKDKDRRTTIIHSQIMRPDQMIQYKSEGLIPSFFTNHTYYWGDVHLANLGSDRASYLSPMKAAFDSGIPCTNHTDYTVTPMDQFFLLWTSVNRISRNGKIIGKNQRITPYQGLQALTIHAAYQYFEEDTKGSLKKGKLADLVVLDKNPLRVKATAIKSIHVVETIKNGVSIYKRK
ncbi:amidohydrolase [Fluviicola taffensis]|uniref:amidohydrolase n=1 Tax=Fluviicola taffensis TaxID=191579 RepID=UPI0031383855